VNAERRGAPDGSTGTEKVSADDAIERHDTMASETVVPKSGILGWDEIEVCIDNPALIHTYDAGRVVATIQLYREALNDIHLVSRDDGLVAMCNWMRGRAVHALEGKPRLGDEGTVLR
jgi:hypothetical protein